MNVHLMINKRMFPNRKPVVVGESRYGEGVSLKSMDERLRRLEEALIPLVELINPTPLQEKDPRICKADNCFHPYFTHDYCNAHSGQLDRYVKAGGDASTFVPKPIRRYRYKALIKKG